MTNTDWAGFAAAVLLIELTPGPNMAWLAAVSMGEGRRAGGASGAASKTTVISVSSCSSRRVQKYAVRVSARYPIGYAVRVSGFASARIGSGSPEDSIRD